MIDKQIQPQLTMTTCCTLADCTHETNNEEQKIKNAKRGGISFFNCDCMDFMTNKPNNFYDLIIVDPPYNDYFSRGGQARKNAKLGNYKIDSLNGNKPTDEYWDELLRISQNQIIWGINWVQRYFGAGGIVWYKDNTGNYSPCELAYQSFDNHIRHFEYRWNGMLQGNMKHKEIRIHPTQKPVQLYRWILQNYASPGMKILDTHGGSMSIAIACDMEGFDLDICEIDKEYFENGLQRFDNYKKQLKLF